MVNFCKVFPVGTKVRYRSKRGRKKQEIIYLPQQRDDYFVILELDEPLRKAILWNPTTLHIVEKRFETIIYHTC